MNATLWVIWIALAVLLFCVGLTIGSQCFPSEQRLDGAWRDGYERGCGDELASCAPCDRPHAAEPPWDDTADGLAGRAAPYYEPLARGAGGTHPPVTTAPCSGEDGHSHAALKGDSPGPGLPAPVGCHWPDCADSGACDFRGQQCAADAVFVPARRGPAQDFVAAAATIYDQLVSDLGRRSPFADESLDLRLPAAPLQRGDGASPSAPAHSDPLHQATASQPAGAEAKPPGPAMVPGEMPGRPLAVTETAGPGADPWQEIVAANQEVWEPFTDTDVFTRIGNDLEALRSALSAPVQLPPWKDSQ